MACGNLYTQAPIKLLSRVHETLDYMLFQILMLKKKRRYFADGISDDSVGLGVTIAPSGRQAIPWTNYDSYHWCVDVLPNPEVISWKCMGAYSRPSVPTVLNIHCVGLIVYKNVPHIMSNIRK